MMDKRLFKRIEFTCPICGNTITLKSLHRHQKKHHMDVTLNELKKIINDFAKEGKLIMDTRRIPRAGNPKSATQVLTDTKEKSVRSVVSGGAFEQGKNRRK